MVVVVVVVVFRLIFCRSKVQTSGVLDLGNHWDLRLRFSVQLHICLGPAGCCPIKNKEIGCTHCHGLRLSTNISNVNSVVFALLTFSESEAEF